MATRFAAIVLAALLVGLAVLTCAAYTGILAADPVRVWLEVRRAGLLLQNGSLVKYHGVEVGRVVEVSREEQGAVVRVELAPDAATDVPAGVGADITATTVFGAKQVVLTDPAVAATGPIADGAVIRADSVTAETNSILDRLTAVLDVVQPQQLQATLSAAATALRGRGTDLGLALDDIDAVLATLDPALGALSTDISAGAEVSGTLGDVAPNLVASARSATVTADSVVSHRQSLDALLLGVIGLADTGTPVLADNTRALTDAASLSRPTTALFAEYSSGLTCFIQGADVARVGAEKVSGGNGRSMLLNSTILFGVDAYRYPTDLPEVRATGGPRCGALPELTAADVPAPYVAADTGADVFGHGRTGPTVDPNSLLTVLVPGLPGGAR
ncbi:MCE family protein [Rhodococcus sp. NPDC003322]